MSARASQRALSPEGIVGGLGVAGCPLARGHKDPHSPLLCSLSMGRGRPQNKEILLVSRPLPWRAGGQASCVRHFQGSGLGGPDWPTMPCLTGIPLAKEPSSGMCALPTLGLVGQLEVLGSGARLGWTADLSSQRNHTAESAWTPAKTSVCVY